MIVDEYKLIIKKMQEAQQNIDEKSIDN